MYRPRFHSLALLVGLAALLASSGCRVEKRNTDASAPEATSRPAEASAAGEAPQASEASSNSDQDDVMRLSASGYKLDPPSDAEIARREKQLDELSFKVLRKEGTEYSGSSDLLHEKRAGNFVCKLCGLPLFASGTKFKSGTGWPSYFRPIDPDHVHEETDYKIGYARTEVECGRCRSHLGHVFDDGPKPTGLRYCINGAALEFLAADAKVPERSRPVETSDR